MTPRKITVLVLPPDERIQTVNGRIVYRYPNGNSGHVSVDSEAPHFALICIGLWRLIQLKHQNYNDVKINFKIQEFAESWESLASGELKIADVKFRQCTKRERKELGL